MNWHDRRFAVKQTFPLILFAGILLVLLSGATFAQEAQLSLAWWTVDGGGGTSSGGEYILSGTSGQPDAGVLTNGEFKLEGGFWAARPPQEQRLYLPLVSN
jgi:hypothetical protein